MKVLNCGVYNELDVVDFNTLTFCKNIAGDDGVVHVAIKSDFLLSKQGWHNFIKHDLRKRRLLSLVYNHNTVGPQSFVVNHVHIFSSDKELEKIVRMVNPDIIVKDNSLKGYMIPGEDIAEVKYISFDGGC